MSELFARTTISQQQQWGKKKEEESFDTPAIAFYSLIPEQNYEFRDKRLQYESIAGEYILMPFEIYTSCVWGKEALLLSKEIADRLKVTSG